MKILLVSGPDISLKEPYNSGIEAFMVSLADQLADEGHTVDVIAEMAEDDARFTLVNPFTSSVSNCPDFLKRFIEQKQFSSLDVSSYDVIHYNMFYPQLLTAGLLHFNKPLVLTLHSPADDKRVSVYQKLSGRGNITFVAISERIKQQWDSALGLNIPLIANGINISHWASNSPRANQYLLWSARINAAKNVAAAISLAKHMQLPLKIAGRIADQRYFDEEVKPHLNHQIQYLGHITQRELSQLAKQASAYLATATWQEPFGLASLEMLASGIPVVGFDTAIPPDWVDTSILTTSSLRWQDLVTLVEQSYAISSESCTRFASDMSVQRMASAYIKLYRNVLLKEDVDEEALLANNQMMQLPAQQPQIFN